MTPSRSGPSSGPPPPAKVSLSSGDMALAGIGAGTTALGGFLFAWIAAQSLGPAGTGVVMLFATLMTTLIVITKVGMDTSLVWACARAVAGTESVSPMRLLAWALAPAVTFSSLIALVLWFMAERLAPLLIAEDPDSGLDVLLRGGAVALPMAVGSLLVLSALRGAGHAKPFLVIDQVAKPGVRLAVAAVIAVIGAATASSLMWAWLSAVPLGLVLALASLARRRHEMSTTATHPDDAAEPQDSARTRLNRFAAPRMLAQSIDIVNASIGTFVLAAFGSATDTGLFTAALRLALGGQLAYQAMRLIIAPVFAHDLSLGRVTAAQRTYVSATVLIVLASWPIYLLMVGAPTVVLSIYGSGFEEAAPILVVLALGTMLLAFLGNMQAAVLMSGRATLALAGTAVGLVVNLSLTLGLLSLLGPTAAALGWTVGVAVEACVLMLGVRRVGLRPASWPVIRAALTALAIMLPGWFIVGQLWNTSIVGALAAALVFGLAYLAAAARPAIDAWQALTAERRAFKGLKGLKGLKEGTHD